MNKINMDYNELRQLYLKDMISRNKTGISPLHKNGRLARRYSNTKSFSNVSLFSSFIMAFYAYNKQYTGRQVYFLGFGAAVLFSLISKYETKRLHDVLFASMNCKDQEDFANKLWVHKYTFVDQKDYYQNRA